MSQGLRICVTGGTGLAGRGIEETMPRGATLVSAHLRRYRPPRGRAVVVRVDVRNRRSVEALFRAHRFDAVVHAAGIANVDYSEAHVAESWESNLIGTYHVAAACQRTGAHLVYLSSNAVFDGLAAPYREDDPVGPVNRYGRLKVECEQLVREMATRLTIVRPILMYGWNAPTGRLNPITWVLRELGQGRTVRVVDDVRENPLYNRQFGEAIWRIVQRRPKGIVHVAGADVLSRYELARKVAAAFGLPAGLVQPVSSRAFPDIAPRPPDTSFSTTRMRRELGITPMTVDEGLRDMRRRRRSVR